MRRRARGVGMIEVLLSLILVGIILGLVARGYQVLNQLSVVSYKMSQKLELSSFLRRLGAELSGAITVTPGVDQVTFTKTDPTLNLEHDEARDRLPWPIPAPPPASVDLDTLNVTVRYFLDNTKKEIRRTYRGVTSTSVANVGAFSVTFDQQNRLATLTVKPDDNTAGATTTVYLPVVRP